MNLNYEVIGTISGIVVMVGGFWSYITSLIVGKLQATIEKSQTEIRLTLEQRFVSLENRFVLTQVFDTRVAAMEQDLSRALIEIGALRDRSDDRHSRVD